MREITKIMKGWEFTGPDGTTTTVDLPHTWNARDGQDGGNDYWRGTCIYRTRFAAPQFNTASHQVWIQFDGVNASAHVVLNGLPRLQPRRRLLHLPRQHHRTAAG